jgi:calcineurin-like phosphoesterase family protein
MSTFFTSDLHFGHANIIEYCRRPFTSVDRMNAGLIERWNSVVGTGDDVWVLGDVCMGHIDDSLAYVEQLHGTKRLIVGNHDRMFKESRREEWEDRYRAAGFVDIIHGQHTLATPDGDLLLCHFPYQGDSGSTERFADWRPADQGLPLLHGHVHGRWRKNGRMVDVGADAWGGYPVRLDDIMELLAKPDAFLATLNWD